MKLYDNTLYVGIIRFISIDTNCTYTICDWYFSIQNEFEMTIFVTLLKLFLMFNKILKVRIRGCVD